ncbi:hypothetical protein [Methylocella silvestris]|uniref:Uncharacterized protein n=1 Tax=Methylocella silvestris TaxID=199596 RepID=A0A2J7TEJ8_METSI|nr:hypothetical protein [Methylocella silvestris]PNG25195.1 hypothetical protein CR492_14550 [Methylocella silvestris]
MTPVAILGALTFMTIGLTWAGEALAQLSQITACVEVPQSTLNQSRMRRSTRSNCDPAAARRAAISQSHVNARDALASTCRQAITPAVAAAVCAGAGKSRPTTPTVSLQSPPIAAGNGARINAQLPISGTGPKICAVLRDLPAESSTTRQSDALCVLNNFRKTVVTFRSRARCGVQCRP